MQGKGWAINHLGWHGASFQEQIFFRQNWPMNFYNMVLQGKCEKKIKVKLAEHNFFSGGSLNFFFLATLEMIFFFSILHHTPQMINGWPLNWNTNWKG